MTRLPKVSRVPDVDREKLARWLRERGIDRSLAGDGEATAGVKSTASGLSPGPAPKPGEIRLMHPFCPATRDRLCYLAILEIHATGLALAVPFGRYAEPATEDELKTGRDSVSLQVLCLWNARLIPLTLLGRSWAVSRLTKKEDGLVRALLRGEIAGSARKIIGPRLVHPLDPRHEYLEEERAWMDEMLASSPAHFISLQESGPGLRDLPLAAEDRPTYGKRGRKPRRGGDKA